LPLHLRGWPRKKVDERARELLALVQLEHRLNHLPEELSGGERQRVAIARALSVYPPILLADEPTGNLDTRTGDEILALIRDLHSRFHSTVLLVTHDLRVAASCDRTITLRDGRVVSDQINANETRATHSTGATPGTRPKHLTDPTDATHSTELAHPTQRP
jgi:predicted ABC-type transport system involved in lysophospholipase L1 biosynthesis ATPase subunit